MTKARVNADNASADIQGVTAGTGLTGGGTSGTVTLTNDMATVIAAKGDLVVGTGNDTYSVLTAAENGSTLVADSSTSTGLSYQANWAAGKNKIINGDMSIWQRGTTFTPSAGVATYTADRMRSVVNSGTTISRQTFTPGTAPVAGYEGQFYFNATITANNQNYEHVQFIENARTFAGQTVTLSFFARSTVGAQPMNVALYQNFGTGGSPSSLVSISPTSGTTPYTPTSSWVRYIYTFDVPSVSGKTFGTNNDSYLWVRFGQYTTTATNTSLDIWGLQLEAGSVATAFQTATGTLQGELAACQRYYFRNTNASASYVTFCPAVANSSTQMAAILQFPVPMRIAPSVLEFSNLAFENYASTQYTVSALSITGQTNTTISTRLQATMSGATAGHFGYLNGQNSSSAYLAVSAEL